MTDLSRWVHLNNMLPKMGASSNIGQKDMNTHTHTHTHARARAQTQTHTQTCKQLVKCDDRFVKMGASQQYVAQDGCI